MSSTFTRHKTQVLLLPLIILLTVVSLSCENDLRDVAKVANIQEEEQVNISNDVIITYSDSAVVKAELTSPEMREYPDSIGLLEFQKGLVIHLFDEEGKQTQKVVADYGVQRINTNLTELRKNVVVTTADGGVIKTEELFYDQDKNIYYNTVPISFDFKDGRGSFHATSFISDAGFKKIDGQNATAVYIPTEDSQFPTFGN